MELLQSYTKPSTDDSIKIPFAIIMHRYNDVTMGNDNVWNHHPHDRLLNRLFRRRSKKTSKLRVTGLCAGNSPGTGEFPAQMASNVENVSIWWRHHVLLSPHSRGGQLVNSLWSSDNMWHQQFWTTWVQAIDWCLLMLIDNQWGSQACTFGWFHWRIIKKTMATLCLQI